MTQNIAILLNGAVKNDSRVIKTINTLAKKYSVDLFYINGQADDKELFNDKTISLFSINYPQTLKQKILRHSFFFYEFNFLVKEVKKTKKQYTIIYCNDLPTLKAGLQLKSFFNAKLIFDSHEIYLETINQFFIKGNNFFKNIIFSVLIAFMRFVGYNFEKNAVKKVDLFITVNKSLAEYFKEKYNLNTSPYVMMNFPYLFEIKQDNLVDFRKKYNWNISDFILIYQGNLNAGRGLELIIDTIKKLPGKFKLIIIGDGILMPQLKTKTENLKLNNRIKFLGFVDNRELLNYTAGADAGFNLLETLNKSKAMASPNKLFEYIQAEIPSINTNTIENKRIVEKYKTGILVNNDESEIFEKIIEFSEKTDIFKQNCKTAKLELNWGKQENSLLIAIKKQGI
jgi:glycosyltransferase involved in cell wall biosynthesis